MDTTMVQDAMTIAVILTGLFFSLTCALLVEELVFGAIFRCFFERASFRRHQSVREADMRSH
jgi:hypothetical protein